MKINFDAIEARLKSLVESSSKLVPSQQSVDQQRIRLAEAVRVFLQDQYSEGEDLPASLICLVPAGEFNDWQDFPFSETMQSILQENGQAINQLPGFSVAGDPELLDGEILIREDVPAVVHLDKTASMPSLSDAEEDFLGDYLPENAFIIVNGLDTIPLSQPVFNIGRRLENDLVIEDPRISREHAQIRAVKGQYVIFDLNSTGGTFVNSIRISKQPLFPGDVISLAGVPLVYGQDNPPAHARTGPVEPFFDPSTPRDQE